MGKETENAAQPVSKEKQTGLQRTFLGEVGIIVLGVLVALVIGEAASAVRQRVDAQRSMEAIRADMIDNAAAFEVASLTAACAERRLDAIANEIANARQTGLLRDIGDISRPGATTLRSGSWDSAVANQNVLYLDEARVATLTDYHEALSIYEALQAEISLDWARLAVLTHAPGRIDDNTLATARQTLAELRYRTEFSALIAQLLLQTHQELGFPVEYLPFNGQPQTKDETFGQVQAGTFCQPLELAE